ncbi:hypothetical protein BV25DRAFT_1917314 [Artomyces pyxidatus]|uniref:Uncharacterized protein n=1 Tax=Artomyces pyxidatus TaxID=48021 RepID=A0ACB8SXD8_9AGAM|nr:hypothetical protein BV25DRAFT_1917314 [Artomyces pyxidatus]
MDQESFRKLLQTSRPGGSTSTTTSRPSLVKPKAGASKSNTASSSDPAFKPRKVKKSSGSYRDRAEERRLGKESDYAQVEAVLEDFERKNAEAEDKRAVEEQRRYLGGDSDHSILVKGLDFALLEQNKARLASASSKQDDELLEVAFAQVASTSILAAPESASKKRSRADIIKELKGKRAEGAPAPELEPRPDPGKFRPIGFKPIGASEETGKGKKKSKAKDVEGGERKKKKRKVDAGQASVPPPPAPVEKDVPKLPAPQIVAEPEPEPAEDFDIFAGAGEYEGIKVDSDEDSESERPSPRPAEDVPPPLPRRGWFDGDDEEPAPPPPDSVHVKSTSRSPRALPDERDAEEEEQPVRLMPLASSAVPSIRDLLAIDDAAEKKKKWKEKKEKKGKGKGGGGDGGGDKDKLEKDYQRLKSYEAKKAAK